MQTTTAAPPLLGEPLPVELMNTIWADRDGVYDALHDPEGLGRWLESVGLAGPVPDIAATEAFRQVRDGLRMLAATVTTDRRPAAVSATADLATAIEAVNRACAQAPSWSELTWPADAPPSSTTRSAHSHPAPAMSHIAELAVSLFSGPERDELRACQAPGCVLYFVRNHPRREWCSASCGNRARVARHYQRHHPSKA